MRLTVAELQSRLRTFIEEYATLISSKLPALRRTPAGREQARELRHVLTRSYLLTTSDDDESLVPQLMRVAKQLDHIAHRLEGGVDYWEEVSAQQVIRFLFDFMITPVYYPIRITTSIDRRSMAFCADGAIEFASTVEARLNSVLDLIERPLELVEPQFVTGYHTNRIDPAEWELITRQRPGYSRRF